MSMNSKSVPHADKGVCGVTSNCTSLHLRRAARAVSHFLEEFLQPLGLHSSQFGILNSISRAGSITMTSLSDEMSLDRTTVTRSVQILERDGLVTVLPGQDRRVREVALTDLGRETLQKAIPLWQQAETALAERLGESQRQTLIELAAAVSSMHLE
jgi:DNA-binding MarR family transcriptional regulator